MKISTDLKTSVGGGTFLLADYFEHHRIIFIISQVNTDNNEVWGI